MKPSPLEAISPALLADVTGGDQLGNLLTNAVRIGMNQRHTSAPPSSSGIHWDKSLGACTDGFGIVNCPTRRR